MPRPKTSDDYYALAHRRGYTWLGRLPKNTKALTEWSCSRGHTFLANYNNVDQGVQCKYCAREDQGARQRHSPADYHAIAYERGILWLGPEVKNAHEFTVWECREGHRWTAQYAYIQQGNLCRFCSAQRKADKTRRQPGEYYALAAHRGFTWLGPVAKNNKGRTRWRCMAGHEWDASFNGVDRGTGCPHCAGLAPKTPQDFIDLAALRGFKWLGDKVDNNRSMTKWNCAKGHTWPAAYNTIRQGNGCPYCAGLARKTADDYRQLAIENGMVWLGPLPKNSKGPTWWLCRKRHKMKKSYRAAVLGGCRVCSKRAPKTAGDYHNLASTRGFQWLGPEVRYTDTHTTWRCGKGHEWKAGYNTILQRHGCPHCLDLVNGNRVSKAQRKICEMVDGELNVPVGRYKVDVARTVDGVRIAIEYDSWFYHAKNQEKDRIKDQKLLAEGWRVLRIRSNRLVPSASQLSKAIDELVAGKQWVDLEFPDWGKGPVAWFQQ